MKIHTQVFCIKLDYWGGGGSGPPGSYSTVYENLNHWIRKTEQKYLNIDDMSRIYLKPCHIQLQKHCRLKFGGQWQKG